MMGLKAIRGLILFSLLLGVFAGFNRVYGVAPDQPKLVSRLDDIMGRRYSFAALQEDYDQFRQCILYYLLPKPYANQEEIIKLFNSQKTLLHDQMSELEFFRVLNPIVVKLHCGHTELTFSQEYKDFLKQKGNYLPLAIKIINNHAYVFHNFDTQIPRGVELVEINGRPIAEILQRLMDNITADGANVTFKYAKLNRNFSSYYFNYIDCSERFEITCRDRNTQQLTKVCLKAINGTQLQQAGATFVPQTEAEKAKYYHEFHSDYASLRINTFSFHDADSIKKYQGYIDDFFKTLSERKIDHLILDLRNNGGGELGCSGYLYSYLVTEATPFLSANSTGGIYLKNIALEPAQNSFKGSLYTLINGGAFSATGILCSLLRYHKIGVFIGEESGGSYIATNGNDEIVLHHTQLRLKFTVHKFEAAVSGLAHGRGIFPDYEVRPTIADYLNGRDPEMEMALKLISRNKPEKAPIQTQ